MALTEAEARNAALAAAYKILEHDGAPGLYRAPGNSAIVAKRLADFIKTLTKELQQS